MTRYIVVNNDSIYYLAIFHEEDKIDDNGEVTGTEMDVSIRGPFLSYSAVLTHLPEDAHIEEVDKLTVVVTKGRMTTKVEF